MAITVLSAMYGTPNAGYDVTAACQALVSNGNDDITASNALGGDPDPGATKFLGILYSTPSLNNGNPIALGCQEGATLDLVPTPATASTAPITPSPVLGAIRVLSATYGTQVNGNNVTAICQYLVNNGNDQIPVNNTYLGPDPDSGYTKEFAILYQVNNNAPMVLSCQEDTTLTLVPIPPPPQA
jgi:hypothetical protein